MVRRDLRYRLHPWFGRDVFVHAATDRANGIFRCTLDGSDIGRSLEIPVWMFDSAACIADVRFSTDPFVSLESLVALSALLDQVLKAGAPSSNPQFADANGISRDQNRGESHDAESDGDGDGDRGSAQTAPGARADGLVRKPARDRRSRLARPTERRAGDAGRPDDAADPRSRSCGGGADDSGGRP
jgi:hypothetical protein